MTACERFHRSGEKLLRAAHQSRSQSGNRFSRSKTSPLQLVNTTFHALRRRAACAKANWLGGMSRRVERLNSVSQGRSRFLGRVADAYVQGEHLKVLALRLARSYERPALAGPLLNHAGSGYVE